MINFISRFPFVPPIRSGPLRRDILHRMRLGDARAAQDSLKASARLFIIKLLFVSRQSGHV